MKTIIASVTLLVASALLGTAAETAKPKPSSPEFDRMKSLVGTWTGKMDMGSGPEDITVRYRVIAGGSVIEERIFEGTPNEMVTMYFDGEDGKLALTHYCMLGNRPAMKVGASDKDTITFDFDAERCSIDPKTECHMHSLTVRFDDADTITTTCQGVEDGKPTPGPALTLRRAKNT